jgi:hypothetical protein
MDFVKFAGMQQLFAGVCRKLPALLRNVSPTQPATRLTRREADEIAVQAFCTSEYQTQHIVLLLKYVEF